MLKQKYKYLTVILILSIVLISGFLLKEKKRALPSNIKDNEIQAHKLGGESNFKEGEIAELIGSDVVGFDFDTKTRVEVHRMIDNRIYVSTITDSTSNVSSFVTHQLGYIDVDTMTYHVLKDFDGSFRLFDYVHIDDTIMYSKITSVDDSGITIDVIKDVRGKVEVIDSMKSIWSMDAPIFTSIGNQVFYYSKNYADTDDQRVLVTFSLKSTDLNSLETITSNSCYADFELEHTFENGCARSMGNIHASDHSIYYMEFLGNQNRVQTYDIASKTLNTATFGANELLDPSVGYTDIGKKLIVGHDIGKNELTDLYLYNSDPLKKNQLIMSNTYFGRTSMKDDILVFNKTNTFSDTRTVFVDVEKEIYQTILKQESVDSFPKYYFYNGKAYAVWSDASVEIDTFELK